MQPAETGRALPRIAGHAASRLGDRNLLVAIDGRDGVGKTTFATALKAELDRRQVPTLRATTDRFHRPAAERYAQGRFSPRGFYERSFRHQEFAQVFLRPATARLPTTVNLSLFDHETDSPTQPQIVRLSQPHVLLVDGIFLFRPEWARHWDFSIFLHADADTAFGRLARREGFPDELRDRYRRRYVGGQALYLAAESPQTRADVVLDASGSGEPTLRSSRVPL